MTDLFLLEVECGVWSCVLHAQYLKQSKMNTTVLEMTVNKFILASGETMLPRENPYMLLQSCNTMGQKNYITGMQQNTNSITNGIKHRIMERY